MAFLRRITLSILRPFFMATVVLGCAVMPALAVDSHEKDTPDKPAWAETGTTYTQKGGTVTAPPGWQMKQVNGELCPGSPPLLIELGKVTIAVPRSTGELVDVIKDGQSEQLPHLNEHIPCDLKIIHNAWQFSLPTVQVILPSRWHGPSSHVDPVESEFDRTYIRRYIAEARSNHTVQTLPSGIETIAGKSRGDIFILPLDRARTADGKQVVLDCDRAPDPQKKPSLSFCATIYMHPSGLMLSYTFPRDKYPSDNFLDADQHFRGLLESWIASAQAMHPQGE